jgi:DNA-binding FrmR family transcriptional regulator
MSPKNSSTNASHEKSDNGSDTASDAALDTSRASTASCGCGAHRDAASEGRKAVAVDGPVKERNIKRLRRIEGQVRGIQKMVDEDRYCADIMTQISSIQEALRSVSRELMRNHLKHCASSAIQSTDAEAESMYDELVDLMFKHSR